MTHTLLRSSLLGLMLLLAGCYGSSDGPVGPPGPPGNANVFSVNFDFFLDASERDGAVYVERFDVPDLTQSVVNEGMVMVYYRFANTWTAMPYTVSVEAPDDPPRVDYTATLGFAYDRGFLDVIVEASTADNVVWEELENAPLFFEALPMKAVIVDGFAAKQGLDWTDYEAVKAYYNLPD